VPFTPLPLLLVTHTPAGRGDAVLDGLVGMLEDRAFVVRRVPLATATPPDPAGFRGVVLAVEDPGLLGLRDHGVPAPVEAFLRRTPGLEAVPLAILTLHRVRRGPLGEALRRAAEARGVRIAVVHAMREGAPERDAHVVPAECMVRMR
jgi:hypothetical protein